jgi:hypothetical protein
LDNRSAASFIGSVAGWSLQCPPAISAPMPATFAGQEIRELIEPRRFAQLKAG